MPAHPLCKTTDLAPGQCLKAEVAGHDIAVYNVDGTFYATDDFCRHRGGHLGEGTLKEHVVVCPDHGWRYDVTNGHCLSHPQGDIRAYPVSVTGEEVRVELPES